MPKQSPANPQDIPFFLSTRLAEPTTVEAADKKQDTSDPMEGGDAVQILARYENRAAKLAQEYEENMARF